MSAAGLPGDARTATRDAASGAAPDDGALCRACGACCAAFRVSFHWLEAEALGLDDTCVEPVGPHRVAMRGTHAKAPRCVALAGTVGSAVACTTYASRPSPCREVRPGDERCVTARARHGLPVPAASVSNGITGTSSTNRVGEGGAGAARGG